MKYSHWSSFKKAVFSSTVPCGFSFPLKEVWRHEWGGEGRNIRISSGAFWNLSCPSLPTSCPLRFWYHWDSYYLIPISERISWIVSHCCYWEWLHFSNVLEERKWLWTTVLKVKSKILCLLFEISYCLLHPQYLSNFNLRLLPTLLTTIAN